jgi:ribonuclease inhibitor
MRIITLDGQKMTSMETSHIYIASELNLPDYYGRNLDALWDILSSISEPIQVTIINRKQLDGYLGEYAQSLLNVFLEAELVNEKFSVKVL